MRVFKDLIMKVFVVLMKECKKDVLEDMIVVKEIMGVVGVVKIEDGIQ